MQQGSYKCQICLQQIKNVILSYCCYRLLCVGCSQSLKHECQISLSMIDTNIDYDWCNRCLVKISKFQCQNCMNKKYCGDCDKIIHNSNKFQFHHKIQLDTNYTNQTCNTHKQHKSIKSSDGSKVCTNCWNQTKRPYQYNNNKIITKVKQLETKLLLDQNNYNSQQITIKQHWDDITYKFNNKVNILIQTMNRLQQDYNRFIQIRKLKTIQFIHQRIKNTKTMLCEIKNIFQLITKQNQSLNTFICQKIKLLTQQANQSYKVHQVQDTFQSGHLDFIKNCLNQLDFNKIILKEKPKKEAQKLRKVTSASGLLSIDKKINQVSPRSAIRKNQIDIKSAVSQQNQEDQKIQNIGQPGKNYLLPKKNVFRSVISQPQINKSQQYSINKKLSYSKYR